MNEALCNGRTQLLLSENRSVGEIEKDWFRQRIFILLKNIRSNEQKMKEIEQKMKENWRKTVGKWLNNGKNYKEKQLIL